MNMPKRLAIIFSALCILSLLCPAAGSGQDTGPINPRIKYLRSIDAAPSGRPFTTVYDIFIDEKNEEVFALDTGGRRVVIFDFYGAFLYKFSFVDAGVRGPAVEMAVADDGRIYIAESLRVSVTSYRGIYDHDLDLSTVPDADKIIIQSIAVDGDVIYLGDTGLDRVIVMDREKEVFINQFSEGMGVNFHLAVDEETIYVRDPATFSVFIIDKEGTPQGRFGKVSGLAGGFSQTASITLDRKNGRVIVLDSNRIAVIFFDMEGNFLFEFGGPRTFIAPRTVAADAKGRVYVYDGSRKIRVFEIIVEEPPGGGAGAPTETAP
jgi:DNA-binding beta-propeller fold protein YncE